MQNKKTFFVFLGVFVSFAWGASFTVDDVTEFQNALNICADNGEHDTINVKEGIYNVETLLTYWSEENYSLYIRGEDSVILDAEGGGKIMGLITTSEKGDIHVEGITFQNGNSDYGGALYIETQSAEIRLEGCSFNNNTAENVGGGVNIYSITGSIIVRGCHFIKNLSPDRNYPNGTAGGLFIQTEGSNTEIFLEDCVFEDNQVGRDAAGAMLYPLGNGAVIRVKGNRFKNNHAEEFGGGCFIRAPAENITVEYKNNILTGNSTTRAGSGGGTYIEVVSGSIIFSNNTSEKNNSVWQGGALWIEQGSGTLVCDKNTFTGNNAGENGAGANIYIDNGDAEIKENVFAENSGSASGGGLCISTTTGTISIFNNTFYSNTSEDGGDVYLYADASSATIEFYNNILWRSASPSLSFSGAKEVIARYSDIEDGEGEEWFGPGCIAKDPLFVDPEAGDFHLRWDNFPVEDETKSPCIDAGDPTSPPDPDGTRRDMGAFYFNQGPQGCKESKPNVWGVSVAVKSSQIAVEYFLSKPCNVKIRLYNLAGELVETLVDTYKKTGKHKITWNAERVSSGIYFCQIRISDYYVTKKIILLR